MLEGHTDWVRDVSWAPNIGLPRSYIATASQVSCFYLGSSTPSRSARMCGVARSLTLARGDLSGQDCAGVDKRHADGGLGKDCA